MATDILDMDGRYSHDESVVFRDPESNRVSKIILHDKDGKDIFTARHDYVYDSTGNLIGRRVMLHPSEKPIAGTSTVYYIYRSFTLSSGETVRVATPYHRFLSGQGEIARVITRGVDDEVPGEWRVGTSDPTGDDLPLDKQAQVEVYITSDPKNQFQLYPAESRQDFLNPNPRVPNSIRLQCLFNSEGKLIPHLFSDVNAEGQVSEFSGNYAEFHDKLRPKLWEEISIPNVPDPRIVQQLDNK